MCIYWTIAFYQRNRAHISSKARALKIAMATTDIENGVFIAAILSWIVYSLKYVRNWPDVLPIFGAILIVLVLWFWKCRSIHKGIRKYIEESESTTGIITMVSTEEKESSSGCSTEY